MAQRTAKDTCLLCKQKLADKTGSHYTPAGIIKRVIGKRDYEEAYGLTASEASTSKFMGRSNLNNTSTTIQKPEHVEDHIFCSDCEERLGILEGICHPVLDKMIDDLEAEKVSTKKTAKFNRYAVLPKVHSNIMLVYFYSVIWRQALQQLLDFGTHIFDAQFMEDLRKIIHTEIYKTTQEIIDTDMSDYPPLSLLCTPHYDDLTACFINPNTTPSNPELFYVGPYNVLVWHQPQETAGFLQATGLRNSWKDSGLWLTNTTKSVVGVIPKNTWQDCTGNMLKKEANKYISTLVKKVQQATGFPFYYCYQMLLSQTNSRYKQTGGDYVACMHQIADELSETIPMP